MDQLLNNFLENIRKMQLQHNDYSLLLQNVLKNKIWHLSSVVEVVLQKIYKSNITWKLNSLFHQVVYTIENIANYV